MADEAPLDAYSQIVTSVAQTVGPHVAALAVPSTPSWGTPISCW